MSSISLQKNAGLNRRYKLLIRFANWIADLPNKLIPAPFRIMQIGSLYWQSRALYVAARLGVADALGDQTRSTAALAATLELNEDHLYRLLRMLASLGIFRETAHRQFENSKLSHCIRTEYPESVRSMVLMHNSPEMITPWVDALEPAMKSGTVPFVESHGVELFQYMSENAGFDQLFSQAMDDVESLAGHAFLEDLDWSQFDRIVDVGGSRGSKSLSILKRFPSLKAVVVDRPSIIEGAREYWCDKEDDSLLSRVTYEGLNILEEVPAASSGENAFLCIAVFHALGDDEALQLLKAIKHAMAETSATLIIADAVADETGVNSQVALFDMQMLVGCQGRERTIKEWGRLFASAGFTLQERVQCRTFGEFLVLVGDER